MSRVDRGRNVAGLSPFAILAGGFEIVGPSEADLDAGNHGDGRTIRRVDASAAKGGYAVAILSESFRTDVRSQFTISIDALPGARNRGRSTVRQDIFVGVVSDPQGALEAPNFTGGGWFCNGPFGWGYYGHDGAKRANGQWLPGAATQPFGEGCKVCVAVCVCVCFCVRVCLHGRMVEYLVIYYFVISCPWMCRFRYPAFCAALYHLRHRLRLRLTPPSFAKRRFR